MGGLGRLRLHFHHVSRAIIFIAYDHDFRRQHRHLETVFVLYKHNVLPLESGHAATSNFIQKSDLITNLHLFSFLFLGTKVNKIARTTKDSGNFILSRELSDESEEVFEAAVDT